MSTDVVHLDLDAAEREIAYPDGINLRLGGHTYTLPAELPLDVLDPLIAEDFDLAGLIVELTSIGGDDLGESVVNLLTKRPDLPRQFKETIHGCLRLLMGGEAFDAFLATRPSLQKYGRLIRGVLGLYGTTLGEATASLTTSGTGGATSNQTSDASTESMPEPSSAGPEPSPGS